MIAAWRSVVGLLAAAAMTACAQLPPPEAPARSGGVAPPGACRCADREDPSSRFIGVIGTRAQHAPRFLGVPETNFYCLRSFVDRRTGETVHQLYVSDSYAGTERHWNAARDGAGRPLRFIEVSRNEITCDGGCFFVEEFAATIPENELRASPEGLTVIFTAASGAEKRIMVSGAPDCRAAGGGRGETQPDAARLRAPDAADQPVFTNRKSGPDRAEYSRIRRPRGRRRCPGRCTDHVAGLRRRRNADAGAHRARGHATAPAAASSSRNTRTSAQAEPRRASLPTCRSSRSMPSIMIKTLMMLRRSK